METSSQLKDYEFHETLGTGAFSEVKSATYLPTNKKVAIKIIDKARCKGKENMIETEVSILKRAKHDHIITLHNMFEIDNRIYLVMEMVTGGELFDEIVSRGKYSEQDASRIVQKIMMALDYLHDLGIAHRDLKPENLLLSNRTKDAKIMISDFGLSKIFNDDQVMRTACGTPGYVAPEVLKRQGYGCEVDLWSMGVITYILLCGYPPFYDQNNVELFRLIMAGRFTFDRPWWDNISDNAKDFIRHLLVLDPQIRYTTKQALKHPWITKYNAPPAPPLHVGMQSLDITDEKNLAPGIQSHLQRSLKDERPGLVINQISLIDDSGVVTSSDGLNKSKTKEPIPSRQSNATPGSPTTVYLEPGPRSFKLLTFNINLKPPGLKNNSSDHKDARLALFGDNNLKNYDIIGLQEMFAYGTSRQNKMLQYARRSGYEYYVASPNKGLLNSTVDGGLLILSKYPIIKTEKMTFKKSSGPDRYIAKGSIYAKIAITPSVIVHAFNVHLQSSDVNASLIDVSVQTRLSQLCALKDFIDDCIRGKTGSEPIILFGDFGFDCRGVGNEEYNLLLRILKGDSKLMSEIEGTDKRQRSYPPIRLGVDNIIHGFGKVHPVTYGDKEGGKPLETVLTKSEDQGVEACLDYMFMLNFFGYNEEQTPVMDIKESLVEPFLVKSQPFTQLSDHYGITTRFFAKN